ncbi:hypothetical protein [Streptomyces sp. NPDC057682]|uniref:hypothetical protein n=1 Tax=Streptomyces sp. NPDC057682 TaxID=3346210 RepID=UPI0036C3C9A7
MPDRRRTSFRLPLSERAPLLMREGRPPAPGSSSSSSSPSDEPGGSSGSGRGEDNPFAPPPEDRPDQPWQPRRPAGGSRGEGGDGDAPEGGSSDDRPVWGSQWSSHQPGRQSGTFGGRPSGPGGPSGQGGPEGSPGGGMRWDPTDPVQRRARYSLLSGMWAFFFALFDFPEIALLLGALAAYWSVSALRAKPKEQAAPGTAGPSPAAPAAPPAPGSSVPGPPPAAYAQRGSRQQTTAAVTGLVTAVVALAIVATTFTVQLVYRDYYTCVNDALTKSGQLSCNELLPKPLEPFFGVKN